MTFPPNDESHSDGTSISRVQDHAWGSVSQIKLKIRLCII